MRDQAYTQYPPSFGDWPQERRITHLKMMYTREGLIRLSFALVNYESEREIDSRTRLTKEELAAIALGLDPDRENPERSTA